MRLCDVSRATAAWGLGAILLGAALSQRSECRREAAVRERFATVSASRPHVLAAIDATDLAGAHMRTGRVGTFVGTVDRIYEPADGSVRLVNFHPDYRQAIVAAVMPSDYEQLGDLQRLVGRRVVMRGHFFLHKGRPEVELVSPHQIQIVR